VADEHSQSGLGSSNSAGGRNQNDPRLLLLGMETFATRPGGLNRYLEELAAGLGRIGMSTQTLVLGLGGESRQATIVVRAAGRPLMRRIIDFAKAATMAANTADVVDSHFALYSLWPVMTSLRSKPLVVHFQGPWGAESSVERINRRWDAFAKTIVERVVYRRADQIIVLSDAFKQVLVQLYGINPDKIRVVPPGVDLVHFSPGSKTEARGKLGLPPAAFIALAVRRLTPRMGLDVLLSAWRALTTEPKFLLLAGSGPDQRRLEQLAVDVGPEGTIQFLGQVSEDTLVDLYRAADISILPSLAFEGFGLAALESLACGTPALVSDVGGLPEAVGRLDRSLIVQAGDVEALAGRLKAAHGGQVPDAGACRKYAEGFSWDRVAELHRACYAGVWDKAKTDGRVRPLSRV
jgi:glycosyltransferase involved in cell wall biosynthesis